MLKAQSFLSLVLPRILTDIAIFNVGIATHQRNQDLVILLLSSDSFSTDHTKMYGDQSFLADSHVSFLMEFIS